MARAKPQPLVCRCSHCGKPFTSADLAPKGLTPTHDFPQPARSVCPGSGGYPWSLNDTRPLLKDTKK